MSVSYYIDEIQTYLENLCIHHTDVQHTVNGQRSFARFQSDDQIREIQNHAGSNLVIVSDFQGNRVGDYDEGKMRMTMEIMFMVNAVVIDDVTDAINTAVKKSMSILFDFLSKMELDYEADDCGPLRFLESEKASWQKVEGPWLDNYYGWFLSIPFKSYMPAYNAAKWS